MTALFVSICVLLQGTATDSFSAQCDLQGLYDEMSQIIQSCGTYVDLDTAHAAFTTLDWASIDAHGQRRTWDDVRADALQAIQTRFDVVRQTIEKVSVTVEGAVVLVAMRTEKTIRDDEGFYGIKGRTHVLTDIVHSRDTWIKTPLGWRQKIHETIGPAQSLLDGRPMAKHTTSSQERAVAHAASEASAGSRFGSGTSVKVASVNNKTPATETAFSRATRTTLVGSMMPTSMRST